jgi:Integrase core domain
VAPERPNQVWSIDFVRDALEYGRRLKCLTIVDDFTRKAVDIVIDHGISGRYVTRVLDRAGCFRGLPRTIRTGALWNTTKAPTQRFGIPNAGKVRCRMALPTCWARQAPRTAGSNDMITLDFTNPALALRLRQVIVGLRKSVCGVAFNALRTSSATRISTEDAGNRRSGSKGPSLAGTANSGHLC